VLSWASLKPVLKFSLSIAFLSSVWIVVTQTDKLILSKILPLAEYGYFTLAVLVASGILVISGPISGAILPRMARLDAEGNHAELIRVYRQSTQLVAVIAGSASITISLCAESLLFVWTGDKILAHHAAPILTLYSIGNGILSVSTFPYYLQYAKGDLRLHLIGNALFILFLLPAIIWAANQFGAVGAGYVWLAINLLSFVAWLPLVHRKFEPGLNFKWYSQDTLIIFLTAAISGYFISTFLPSRDSRGFEFIKILITGIFVLLAGFAASTETRARVSNWLILRKQRQES
jgi:O-antigen/teichoic acid export membrane protein